jgi:hypothetical protein
VTVVSGGVRPMIPPSTGTTMPELTSASRIPFPQVTVVSGGVRPMIPPSTRTIRLGLASAIRLSFPQVIVVSGCVRPMMPPLMGAARSRYSGSAYVPSTLHANIVLLAYKANEER